METRLVDHFAAEFKQQVGIDVLKHPKGMAKLKKQVKRTKEILSANSEASITVESLADEHDFRYVLLFCTLWTLLYHVLFVKRGTCLSTS